MPDAPVAISETAWHPHSLASTAPVFDKRAGRFLFAALVAIHIGAIFWILRAPAIESDRASNDDAIEISFVSPEPVPAATKALSDAKPAANAAVVIRMSKQAQIANGQPHRIATISAAAASQKSPLQLYAADGRVRLPESLMTELAKVDSDERVFDYQVPGLAKAGKFFDRPPALTYESTRFDQYWRPDQDLLTELLSRAVEKASKEIRIPVPGHPGEKIVCHVSLLALGGACGVAHNDDGYVFKDDDPATLNEAESKQCKAWWDRIVDAKSQEIWRKTRALYDAECRKPLERKKALPPGR